MLAPEILTAANSALPRQVHDLSGRRFGRLTAVQWVKATRTKWACVCDCGKDSVVLASNLTTGKQKSCGCLADETRAAYIDSLRKSVKAKKETHRKHSLAYARSEKGRARRRANYEENKADYVAKYVTPWRKANPARVNVHTRNRRAKLRGAEGAHTADDVLAIGTAQNWHCAICAKGIADKYHVDHIKPVSKGGSNWPSNLQLLCPACNIHKSDKWTEQAAA